MNGEHKILFMTLPRVYFDRSMHDKTTDFGETIQYVTDNLKRYNTEVVVRDFSIVGCTYRHVYSELKTQFDMVVMFTDVPDVACARKIGLYMKEISPKTKLIIYGDATLVIPDFFKREPFDAFYLRGDQEKVITEYYKYIIGEIDGNDLKGICYKDENGTYIEKDGFYEIDPDEWAYPVLDNLPMEDYCTFVEKYRKSKYVLSFYVEKGCEKGCKYCLCYLREGKKPRWRNVTKCVDFIEKHQNQFQRFKLHAANLASNPEWLTAFCKEMIRRGLHEKVKWKGTICLADIDEELADLCCKAGAYSFGFGVESFYAKNKKGVKYSVEEFEQKMEVLKNIPIRWKGYVMYNMPGQTIEDIDYTLDIMGKYNVVVRSSSYTPYYLLSQKDNSELDSMNLQEWNKKEFLHWKDEDDSEIWKSYIQQIRL